MKIASRIESISLLNAVSYLILLGIAVLCLSVTVRIVLSPDTVPVLIVFVLLALAFACVAVVIGFERVDVGSLVSLRWDAKGPASESEDTTITISDSTETYDHIVSVAGYESERAEALLRTVQSNSSTADPIDELSNVIELGLQSQIRYPIEAALRTVNRAIDTKNYIDTFDETEMRVVRFRGDTLHVKSESKGRYLQEGIRFGVYLIEQDASGDDVHVLAGTAEVTLASERTTEMRILNWQVPTQEERINELRNGNLTERPARADIPAANELSDIDIQTLEQIQANLRLLYYGTTNE